MTRAWLAAALLACACNAPPNTQGSSTAAAPAAQSATPVSTAVHIAHQPPTPKDVIEAAIASAHVPLKISPTCNNVGTEPNDATIGRYLAGFLAEQSARDKKNWIETTIEPGRSPSGDAVSICTLILRHEDGDDRWGWGVQFHVRSSDGLVLDSSFTCVGAG